MYLLDTDVVVWVLRNKESVVSFISHLNSIDSVGLSTLTIAEIYKNIYPSELIETEEFIARHDVYGVDEDTAKQGGLYWQEYNKKYVGLGIIDCLIASTAYLNNLTLVTFNIKHYPMSGLNLLVPREL